MQIYMSMMSVLYVSAVKYFSNKIICFCHRDSPVFTVACWLHSQLSANRSSPLVFLYGVAIQLGQNLQQRNAAAASPPPHAAE